MPARSGPKPHLSSVDVLGAVSALGVRWTMLFADQEITVVNEALDRELLSGNLANAFTLAPQGQQVLADAGRPVVGAHLDLRVDHTCLSCRLDHECWTITCTRCDQLHVKHVGDEEVMTATKSVLADHACVGRLRAAS